MYTEFYGLREKPFALAPDPRFIFMGRSHREAFAHLLYGIEEGEGFIEIVGQIGTGKTTLCRTLLARIGADAEIAFIFNPSPSEIELLTAINREFSLPTTGRNRSDLIEELNRFLLEKKSAGRRVLLVIDEAQNLDPSVLEQIRLLSNLETEREKLVQIVLIGQPELEENLSRSELRQLRQRITVCWNLEPFGADEVGQYIEHRLRIAGLRGPSPFTKRAARALYRASRGIPRVINAIADRALLASYSQEQRRIDAVDIRRAASEMPGARPGWQRTTGLRGRVSAGLLLFGLLVGLIASVFLPAPADDLEAPGTADGAALAPVVSATPRHVPAAGAAPVGTRSYRLDAELLSLSRDGSAAAALDALLGAWGYAESVGSEVNPNFFPSAVREVASLRVLPTRLTREQIEGLNLPAILELSPGEDGERRFAALLGLTDDDRVHMAAGTREVWLDRSDLDRLWTGRAFLVWMNFESLPVLAPGMSGSAVRWLQARLIDLGYLKPGDASDDYDALTAAAMRRFQATRSLAPTGELDAKSMIALYQSLEYGSPRLASVGEAS